MKKLISLVLLALMFLLPIASSAISSKDILVAKSYLKFIKQKPQGSYIKYLKLGLKSKTNLIRGLSSIILYKHFGNIYLPDLKRSFTLKKHADYQRNKRVLADIKNLQKILLKAKTSLKYLNKTILMQLGLFYHFRQKNIWLKTSTGEKLSLASFYRTSAFQMLIGNKFNSENLFKYIDK